jgi:hypothetical protein
VKRRRVFAACGNVDGVSAFETQIPFGNDKQNAGMTNKKKTQIPFGNDKQDAGMTKKDEQEEEVDCDA